MASTETKLLVPPGSAERGKRSANALHQQIAGDAEVGTNAIHCEIVSIRPRRPAPAESASETPAVGREILNECAIDHSANAPDSDPWLSL